MPVNNTDIARQFLRLPDLLEIDGANPFRVRAYRNAAQTIRAQSRSMADMVAHEEDLSKLPGIGDDIAAKIRTIVESGHLPLLEHIETRVPAELSDMMKIESLGPKRVKKLHRKLGIRSIEDLKRAARTGRIRGLPGFVRKTEEAILKRVEAWTGQSSRMLLAEAEGIARPLLEYLKGARGVKRLIAAGSYRNMVCEANSYSCGNGFLKKPIAERYPGIVTEFCAWWLDIATNDRRRLSV